MRLLFAAVCLSVALLRGAAQPGTDVRRLFEVDRFEGSCEATYAGIVLCHCLIIHKMGVVASSDCLPKNFHDKELLWITAGMTWGKIQVRPFDEVLLKNDDFLGLMLTRAFDIDDSSVKVATLATMFEPGPGDRTEAQAVAWHYDQEGKVVFRQKTIYPLKDEDCRKVKPDFNPEQQFCAKWAKSRENLHCFNMLGTVVVQNQTGINQVIGMNLFGDGLCENPTFWWWG